MARKAEAVHLAGHYDIGKHEINSVELDLAERRFGTFDPPDGIAELFQQVGADGCDIRIVFDQQHGTAAAGFEGTGFFDLRGAVLARQQHRDPGALAEFAVDPDSSAGLMREAVNLREPQSRALADRLGGEERIEDLAEHIRGDAGAVILYRDRNILAGMDLFTDRFVTC